jgi:uncharacterized protein YcfL
MMLNVNLLFEEKPSNKKNTKQRTSSFAEGFGKAELFSTYSFVWYDRNTVRKQ